MSLNERYKLYKTYLYFGSSIQLNYSFAEPCFLNPVSVYKTLVNKYYTI